MPRRLVLIAIALAAALAVIAFYIVETQQRAAVSDGRASYPEAAGYPSAGAESAGAATGAQPVPVQPDGASIRLLRDARAGDNRIAVLLDDLLYCYPPTGDIIIVPMAYATDFASVPGGLNRLLEEYGQSIEAAIVHDWLYAVGERGRKQYADDVFRYALREQGVSMPDRWLKWLGVTAGGGHAYGRASEWEERFHDPRGYGPIPPPYQRRTSGVVTRVNSCEAIDTIPATTDLRVRFGSATWPRVGT